MILLRHLPFEKHLRVAFNLWLRKSHCRRLCAPFSSSAPSFSSKSKPTIDVLGKIYHTDSYTNITPSILSKVSAGLTHKLRHPLCTLQYLIASHFPDYAHFNTDNARFEPFVSPQQNFDELSFPADHPGRSVTDSYYVNRDLLLRTHTSAHEVEVFKSGLKKWLLTADAFRRDEIDASHYPVFHQTEGARLFKNDLAESGPALRDENEWLKNEMETKHVVLEDKTSVDDKNPYQLGHSVELADLVTLNLKCTLSLLLAKLFAQATGTTKSNPLQVRWIPAYFPFTSPSYEVEVFFQGRWLEVLGCGVVQQATLTHANIRDEIGWAFGLGLERIAMILFKIPDIRLFWSGDERFISQFKPNEITTFKQYSKYPSSWNDISFWLPERSTEVLFHPNDFCDIVRDAAGDLAEEVNLIDQFVHPKTNRASRCFRIVYRSMDRSLKSEEVNALTQLIKDQVTRRLGVEIR